MLGSSIKSKSQYLALISAVLLFVIGGYGLWRLSIEYPRHWAVVVPFGPNSDSPRLALDQQLQNMVEKNSRVRSGAQARLATFLAKDGATITLVAADGQFYGASIEPHDVWSTRGKDVLLVSSVDEHRSTRGALAEAHTAGCALASKPEAAQSLGDASITPCAGVYGSRFGISRIARLSVIVDENPGSENQPCWMKFGIALSESGYQDCVRKALATSFSGLFAQIARNPDRTRAIIFPAVATGAGGLSKAAFYEELLPNALVTAIGKGGLPSMTIYLQVNRYDPADRWLETRVAMAGAVTNAVENWEEAKHDVPSSEWLTLTGVALTSGVILFAIGLGAERVVATAGLDAGGSVSPILLVAWLAAAVGIASTFKAFVSLAPTAWGPYAQIAAGAVAAILAGPLTRAADKIKESLKTTPDPSGGDPDVHRV